MTDTVLIVDDSLTVRMDLAGAFEKSGFRPVLAATLAEAREAFRSEPVKVVVLDVLLPDGDGMEFLEELRAMPSGSEIAILMLSTEADVKNRIRGLATGADEYVGKPYDTEHVVARARDFVRSKRGSTSPPGQTILIIDDSITFREAMSEAFQGAGYYVLTATSGEEGLRLIADRRPNLVVVDGQLPGMDGPTLIRRVRLDAALRGIPCVLLTGSDDHDAELRAFEAGADAFIRKEEYVEVILGKIAAALRGTAASRTVELGSLVGPHKILAVHADPGFHHALAHTLQGEGYDIVPARSGDEALELLAVQPVECVLVDVLVPGISGRETCERIKSTPILRNIPLILLAAHENRFAMLDGLSAGADDYVSTSSGLDVLKARIRAQIRRKQFEDENRRIRDDLLRNEMAAAEARAAKELAETRATLVAELERKNGELEAFSYSVSHDLRAPLRAIDGFSKALMEDYGAKLEEPALNHLKRVRSAAQRMSELIDDMLLLSRVTRAELTRSAVDVSAAAHEITADLQRQEPARHVDIAIDDGLHVDADPRLIKIVLENLIGNAWKFTRKAEAPRIEVHGDSNGAGFTVRDNGAGFDMQYAGQLFRPFYRLHTDAEFPGTGIGLATIQRVVERHGGRVWAQAEVGKGATFHVAL